MPAASRRELTDEAQHGLVYPCDAVLARYHLLPRVRLSVRPSVRPSVCHKSKFHSKRLDSSTDAFLNALHFKEIHAPAEMSVHCGGTVYRSLDLEKICHARRSSQSDKLVTVVGRANLQFATIDV